MNISAEEKNRYLREAEVVLAREGFLTDRTNADRLRVLLDGLPLCEVPESGGVTYRMVDISTPERVAAKDRVYSIVRAVLILPSTAPTAPSSTMVRRSAVKHWTTTLMCLALTPITSPSTDRCKSA